MKDETERKLWEDYRSRDELQSRQACNSLVIYYKKTLVEPLAKKRICLNRPLGGITIDQLIQAGAIAVFNSMKKFDLTRGTKFVTFVTPRIRGSFEDLFRKEGNLQKTTEDYLKRYNESFHEIRQNNALSYDERRGTTGLTEKRFKMAESLANSPLCSSYNLNLKSGGEMEEMKIDTEFESPIQSPVAIALSKDIKNYFLRGLNRHERTTIALYYYEGFNMAEIGRVLNLTESRVSQIHSEALEKLKCRAERIKKEVA